LAIFTQRICHLIFVSTFCWNFQDSRMDTFLEVNEGYLENKLRLIDVDPSDKSEPEFIWPAGPAPKILTPSQRQEAAQCKFVIPNPGMCIKTRDEKTGKKVFVNLCHSEDVPEPQVHLTDQELADILDGGSNNEVDDIRFPMSIGDKRDEVDKAGKPSFACDCIVNAKFFRTKLLQSKVYQTFLIVVALEGIDEKHKMELDKNGYTILQNTKSYGKLTPQFLKSKANIREIDSSEPLVGPGLKSKSTTLSAANSKSSTNSLIEVVSSKSNLDITIIQVSEELAKAQIQFPPMRDPKKLEVEFGADRIIVNSPVGSLDVFVPLDIYQEKSKAEFNLATNILTLTIALFVMP